MTNLACEIIIRKAYDEMIETYLDYRSMIITGCSPWTLYEYPNYGGQSACWYPADTINCYPSFFRDPSAMNGWANQISSVRHGCYSNTKYYGEPLSFSKMNKLEGKGAFLQK